MFQQGGHVVVPACFKRSQARAPRLDFESDGNALID